MPMFGLVVSCVFGILLAAALAITRLRALYEAAMLAALFSLVTASLFVVLDAADVAFTEAAVGAGISTVLFLTVLALTRSREAVTPRRRVWPGAAVATATGATLVYASNDLPSFGAADAPVHAHPVTRTYLEDSPSEIGIPNTVTSVLASYRGFDTLGELVVILTAGVAVLLLLVRTSPDRADATHGRLVLANYRVLRVVSKVLLPFILLFAFYVLLHGEYGPGGGFQAGVIFASGFVLYGLVFGLDDAQRALPRRALLTLIPLGVLLFVALGLSNMLLGGAFLDYDSLDRDDPKAGQHLGILLAEIGVGVTVAAVMTAVFFSFARRGITR